MARTSIYDVLSVGDAANVTDFDIFFPNLPGSSDSRDLTYKAQSTELPGMGLEIIQADLHGVKIPYAGNATYNQSWTVTFLETMDWMTREKFRRWKEITRSWRDNAGTLSSTYKVNVQIALYNAIPQVVRTVQINGVFIETINEISLDGSNSGPVTLQVQFKYTDVQDL